MIGLIPATPALKKTLTITAILATIMAETSPEIAPRELPSPSSVKSTPILHLPVLSKNRFSSFFDAYSCFQFLLRIGLLSLSSFCFSAFPRRACFLLIRVLISYTEDDLWSAWHSSNTGSVFLFLSGFYHYLIVGVYGH